MQGKELHQLPQPNLQTESFSDSNGFGLRNAGDLTESCRLPLHDPQGIFSKTVNDALSQLGTDPLNAASGQISLNVRCSLGHEPFQKFRFELAAVAAVAAPFSGDH